eukprot:765997_1
MYLLAPFSTVSFSFAYVFCAVYDSAFCCFWILYILQVLFEGLVFCFSPFNSCYGLFTSLCRGIIDIIEYQNSDTKKANDSETADKSIANTIRTFIRSNVSKHKKNDDSTTTHHVYDSSYVAEEYARWYHSDPFDIGGCTTATVGEAPHVAKMKRTAYDYNTYGGKSGNLANGSLMRCMPLIVYGYKLKYDELYNLMTEDSSLTHANPVIFVANTVYAISAQYLLHTHHADAEEKKKDDDDDDTEKYGRNALAFIQGEKWLNAQRQNKKENKAFEEVYEWLMDCKQDDISKLHSAGQHIGFVKIAFQRALYHLWNGTEFETAIRMTIAEGGDTDTNACIVGGLIGALCGLNKIPNKFKDRIMYCAPAKPKRDEIFQAKLYVNKQYIETVIKNAPNTVEVKMYKMTASII